MEAVSSRDHVFISYATEDASLADWLARKLASLGYAVWYDRLRLLGGEPWPKDIDVAIKTRTFRMLALLSRASIQKDNPSRERTTAQAVGRELKIPDFLITLNVDGLKPTEIPWTLSEVNYIGFASSWAEGLAAVVRKLESVRAPRTLPNGAALAVDSISASQFIRHAPERLCSNCLTVERVPEVVHRFTAEAGVLNGDAASFKGRWACRRLAPGVLLAFAPPPEDIQAKHRIKPAGGACWKCMSHVDGIESRDLVVSLIHASTDCLFASRGLVFSPQQWEWYIPAGLLEGDWLRHTKPDGSTGRVLSIGERTFRSGNNREIYRYHLSPSLSVLRGSADPYVLVLRNRVYLTDQNSHPLDRHKIPSRRKHLCRNWWNDDWLARTLGVLQLLAGDGDAIRVGPSADSQIVISGKPLMYDIAVSLDETEAEPIDPDFVARDEEYPGQDERDGEHE